MPAVNRTIATVACFLGATLCNPPHRSANAQPIPLPGRAPIDETDATPGAPPVDGTGGRTDFRGEPPDWNSGFHWFLPVLNSEDAKRLYGKKEITGPKSIQTGVGIDDEANSGSIVSDLLNLHFHALSVRFQTAFAAASDEADSDPNENAVAKEAASRLLGAGGTLAVNVAFPLIHLDVGQFRGHVNASITGGLNIPSIGTSTTGVNVSADFGIDADLYFDALSVRDKSSKKAEDVEAPIRFFLNFRTAGVHGTDRFFDTLNLERRSFLYSRISGGVDFRLNLDDEPIWIRAGVTHLLSRARKHPGSVSGGGLPWLPQIENFPASYCMHFSLHPAGTHPTQLSQNWHHLPCRLARPV